MMPSYLKENFLIPSVPQLLTVSLETPLINTDVEKKEKPLFTLIQTPAEKFLALLYSHGIINEIGRFKLDFSIPLPCSEHHAKTLSNWLNHYLLVEMGNKEEFDLHLLQHCQKLNIFDSNGVLIEGLPTDQSHQIRLGTRLFFSYQQIIEVLIERKIIDDKGNLKIPLSKPSKGQLKIKSSNLISKVFNKKNIKVRVGKDDDFYCSCYVQVGSLLQFLLKHSPSKISSIKIIGGRARKHFIDSREFCLKAFQTLIKFLNLTGIENITEIEIGDIIEELFQKKEEASLYDVADEDIRFEVPEATKEDLYASTNNVILFLSQIIFGTNANHMDWIQNNAFKKLKVFLNGFTNFSIASLGDTQLIELIFAQTLTRNQLFSDEITQDITHVVNKISNTVSPSFYSEVQNEWQALICNLGNIFHIDHPNQVNEHAFPMLLSRLCHGKLVCNLDGLRTFIKDALNPSLYTNVEIPNLFVSKGIAGRLAFQFIKCLKNHHPFNLYSASIAYTFSACSLLQEYISQNDIETIFILIFSNLSLENHLNSIHPLLRGIVDAIIMKKIPFQILTSLFQIGSLLRLSFPIEMKNNEDHSPKSEVSPNAMNKLGIFIREIEKMPMIQIHIQHENLALWCPLYLDQSIESFVDYANCPSTPFESLKIFYTVLMTILVDSLSIAKTEPVLHRYKKIRRLDTLLLEKAAERLLRGSDEFCKYFGYHLLILCGNLEINENLIKLVLGGFIEAFTFQPNPHLREILFTQFKYLLEKTKYSVCIGGDTELQKFFTASLNTPTNEWLLNWIEALSSNTEEVFCEVSFDLWCKYYNQYSPANINEITIKLFSLFVSHSPNLAQKVLKHAQEKGHLTQPEKELKALGNLILAEKQKASKCMQTDNLLALADMTQTFLNREFDIKELPNGLLKKIGHLFLWFFDKLKDFHFDISTSLLACSEKKGFFYLDIEGVRLARLNLCETSLLNQDQEKGTLKAFEIWDQRMNGWGQGECYIKFLISLTKRLSTLSARNKELTTIVNYLAKHHPLALKELNDFLQPHLKKIIDTNSLEEARLQLQGHYKTLLSKDQMIEAWILLCKKYMKEFYFLEAISIWEKLILKSDAHHTAVLKELTESILGSVLEKVSDIETLSFIQKILFNGSHYCCEEQKIKSLKLGLIKSEELSFKQTELLTIYFLDTLFDATTTIEKGETFIDEQTIKCLINFLKFIRNSQTQMPQSLTENLKKSFSNLVIRLHMNNQWEEIHDLVEQFVYHKMTYELTDEAARGCIKALSSLLTTKRMGLNIAVEISKHISSTFPEQEIKPFIEMIFQKNKKNQSPLNMGQLFINERSVMLKGRKPSEWNKEVFVIIQQLLACKPNLPLNRETFNLIFQLLKGYEIAQASVWTPFFEKIAKKHVWILENAYKQFCVISMSLIGTPYEKAQCWNSVFSALSNYGSEAIVATYLKQVLDETSSIASLFRDSDLSDIKDQSFILIILSCLKQLSANRRSKKALESETAATDLALDISKLRECIGKYDINKKNLFPKLLMCDQQLIENLILIKNFQIFQSVCHHLNILVRMGIKDSLFSWTKKLSSLVYQEFLQGSFYETKDEKSEWKAVSAILASQISLIRESPKSSMIDLHHLCELLLGYTTSNIMEELFLTLLSLLNDNFPSLQKLLMSTLTVLIKENDLEKVRILLVHPQSQTHLTSSIRSNYWGDYLLAMVKLHCVNEDITSITSVLYFMLENYNLIIDSKTKEKDYLYKIVELQIKQIDHGILPFSTSSFLNLFYLFTHAFTLTTKKPPGIFYDHLDEVCLAFSPTYPNLPEFFTHTTESSPEFFTHTTESSFDQYPIIIVAPRFHIKDIHLMNFRKRYFKYIALLLEKIMERTYLDITQKTLALYSFVYHYLTLLSFRFPKYANKIANFVNKFVCGLPVGSSIYHSYVDPVTILIMTSYKDGIFTDKPEMLVELLIYLRKGTFIPSHMISIKFNAAAFKAIERCLESNIPNSGVLATDLLCHFFEVFDLNHIDLNKINDLLQKIIVKSKPHYFSRIGKLLLCEIIDDFIFTLKLSPERLFSLIEIGYQLYHDPATTYPKDCLLRSPGNLLIWLVQRLYLSEMISSVHSIEVVTRYYNYVEKILKIPNSIDVMLKAEISNHKEIIGIELEDQTLYQLCNRIFKIIIYPDPIDKNLIKKRNQLYTFLIESLISQKKEYLAKMYIKIAFKSIIVGLKSFISTSLTEHAEFMYKKYFDEK